jgi:hypothetical protein
VRVFGCCRTDADFDSMHRYCGFQPTNRSDFGIDQVETDNTELKYKDEPRECPPEGDHLDDDAWSDNSREKLLAQSSTTPEPVESVRPGRTLSWPALSASQFINDSNDEEYDEGSDLFEDTHRAIKRHCGVHQLPKTLGAMQEVKIYIQVQNSKRT